MGSAHHTSESHIIEGEKETGHAVDVLLGPISSEQHLDKTLVVRDSEGGKEFGDGRSAYSVIHHVRFQGAAVTQQEAAVQLPLPLLAQNHLHAPPEGLGRSRHGLAGTTGSYHVIHMMCCS